MDILNHSMVGHQYAIINGKMAKTLKERDMEDIQNTAELVYCINKQAVIANCECSALNTETGEVIPNAIKSYKRLCEPLKWVIPARKDDIPNSITTEGIVKVSDLDSIDKGIVSEVLTHCPDGEHTQVRIRKKIEIDSNFESVSEELGKEILALKKAARERGETLIAAGM